MWIILSKSFGGRYGSTFPNSLSWKKLLFTNELIWRSNLKQPSKMTPRFWTEGRQQEANGPRTLSTPCRSSEFPNTIISLFFSFKCKKLSPTFETSNHNLWLLSLLCRYNTLLDMAFVICKSVIDNIGILSSRFCCCLFFTIITNLFSCRAFSHQCCIMLSCFLSVSWQTPQ